MIRAVAISSILGVALFALLALAIPGPVADFLAHPENPVIGIVRQRFGNSAGLLMLFVAFASIFACLIANMAVATRMIYALSRDNMLPGSKLLMRVNERTGTPVAAIIVVTAIAIVMNIANGGFVAAIYSMVGLTYYLTYFLTLLGVYMAYRGGRVPSAPIGAFGLVGWLVPILGVGLLWTLVVIATFSIPDESHPGAFMTMFMLAVGATWWLLKLRGALATGRAGPPVA
jgi:amino acid transporter